MDIRDITANYAGFCDKHLEKILLTGQKTKQSHIFEAMGYSVKNGGKRIRPALVFMFYKAFKPDWEKCADFAAALEMIHTYSLIHDDLPCMDDDDFRRGKPSNHRVYGEGVAVLAGDALLNLAFETALKNKDFPEKTVAKASLILANSAGVYGMLGGQVIDVMSQAKDIDSLRGMYALKTGALLSCACRMGALLGGADDDLVSEADAFGIELGIAFQIIDDVLDITGNEEKLGKKTGSDQKQGRTTFATILGVENAERKAAEYTDKCLKRLEKFENSQEISLFAKMLLCREY